MTLAQLLVVQAHDSAIDRLTHSLTVLPEFTALEQLDDEQRHLEAQHATISDQRQAVSREQKRLEDDAALVTDRINLENERLYSGSVTAHKDLQAIQAELATLGERREGIEDGVLELMEQGEPLDVSLGELQAKLDDVESRRAQVNESLAQSQATIDAEIETERNARATAVEGIDSDLLAQYESTRADCGGVGVCRLAGKTCEGCHLTLAAVELDRLRKEPDDAVVRCGECTRILVR